MRMGCFRPVHVKSREAQTLRVLLADRKAMFGKALDMQNMIRGLIRPFGLKVGAASGLGAEAYTSILRPDRVGSDRRLRPPVPGLDRPLVKVTSKRL